jgi:hypothetical protein
MAIDTSKTKELLNKMKPSKKTFAIIALTTGVILGAQSGLSLEELMVNVDKIVPIVTTIVNLFMGSTNGTVIAP